MIDTNFCSGTNPLWLCSWIWRIVGTGIVFYLIWLLVKPKKVEL